jgi:hypothetical protein
VIACRNCGRRGYEPMALALCADCQPRCAECETELPVDGAEIDSYPYDGKEHCRVCWKAKTDADEAEIDQEIPE